MAPKQNGRCKRCVKKYQHATSWREARCQDSRVCTHVFADQCPSIFSVTAIAFGLLRMWCSEAQSEQPWAVTHLAILPRNRKHPLRVHPFDNTPTKQRPLQTKLISRVSIPLGTTGVSFWSKWTIAAISSACYQLPILPIPNGKSRMKLYHWLAPTAIFFAVNKKSSCRTLLSQSWTRTVQRFCHVIRCWPLLIVAQLDIHRPMKNKHVQFAIATVDAMWEVTCQ